MHLRQKLDQNDFAYGTWSQTGSAEVLEILGYSNNFDFTIIDTEHGYYDLGHAENLVRAANASGISPIVRVSSNENHKITKALDIGAQGVLVPQVSSRADAEKMVASARYAPHGNRGACPFVRSGNHLVTDWAEYATKASKDVFVMALVEGAEGFGNLEEIARTEGLDGLMIGPMDLTVSLGIGGQLDHPKLKEYIRNALKICNEANVKFFVPNFFQTIDRATEAIQEWRELGVKYFTVGSDKLFLTAYMNQQHAALGRTPR